MEFYFRSEFHFRFDAYFSASPRSWPGYHGAGRSCTWTGHGGCRSGFPGRWNGIRLAGQVGATYVTVWICVHFYYRQLLTNLLTDLGKFAQTAEARKWLFTVTASLKQRKFYAEMWNFAVGIFMLTVGIFPAKPTRYNRRNAVFIVNIKLCIKRWKWPFFTRKVMGKLNQVISKLSAALNPVNIHNTTICEW